MKRSPLKRGKPLARGAGPKRAARIRRQNPERLAKRRAEAFGPQAELARSLPCAACGAQPPSDPAHVRSRGAGGRDRGNVIPLCRTHHIRQHSRGWGRLERDRGLDASAEAKRLERLAYGQNQ